MRRFETALRPNRRAAEASNLHYGRTPGLGGSTAPIKMSASSGAGPDGGPFRMRGKEEPVPPQRSPQRTRALTEAAIDRLRDKNLRAMDTARQWLLKQSCAVPSPRTEVTLFPGAPRAGVRADGDI